MSAHSRRVGQQPPQPDDIVILQAQLRNLTESAERMSDGAGMIFRIRAQFIAAELSRRSRGVDPASGDSLH